MAEDKKKEIAVIEITEEYMKDRLYEFRGKKVMLDSDLAEIYGYESGMTMSEIAKRNRVRERTIYRYKAYYDKMREVGDNE